MKLYDFGQAPNARRVRMFIAEKGIEIPVEVVDLGSKAQLDAAYIKINPVAEVPALELDDGTIITESSAICLYLEGIYPEPNLMGEDTLEKAQIFMWDRRVELNGFQAVGEAFRNSNPFFENRAITGTRDYAQIPALAERGVERTGDFFAALDERLGNSEYIAGDRFTIADITAFVAVDFARTIKMKLDDTQPNALRWHQAISNRPSAAA